MDLMLETLVQGAQEAGLELSRETAQKLCRFGREVVEQNQVMNLTAITEDAAVAKLHLLDSLMPLKLMPMGGKKLIDVGCGAGFPGVPLKIACPELELTLLDSLGKRINWLESTALPRLGVEARCITARAEEAVADLRESFDFATSRAVARLNILLELTAPFVKVGGFVLALKGTAAREELREAKNAIRRLGLETRQVAVFPMDGTEHAVIVLEKVAPTPAQYPRRYAKIKANPL